MVAVDGSTEPMTDSQSNSSRDGLEHWLQDLRTDLDNDPPDWVHPAAVPDVPRHGDDPDWLTQPLTAQSPAHHDAQPADAFPPHVDEPGLVPSDDDGETLPQPARGGRHRAAD
jgi:hypothetical protein